MILCKACVISERMFRPSPGLAPNDPSLWGSQPPDLLQNYSRDQMRAKIGGEGKKSPSGEGCPPADSIGPWTAINGEPRLKRILIYFIISLCIILMRYRSYDIKYSVGYWLVRFDIWF